MENAPMSRKALLLVLLSAGALASGVPTPDAVTPDGGRYYGPLVGGMMNGKGRIEWASGRSYEGELRAGMMWGKGRLRTAQGNVYQGDFVNGEFTGNGTYTRKDGGRYEGEFRQWVFSGRGRYDDGQGDIWEGTFVKGALDGPGKATSRMGSYEGEFKDWRFNGKGVLKLPNGDVYEGSFADGMYNGQGTLTYAKAKADGRKKDSGIWRYGRLPNDAERAQTLANIETALYSQRRLLDAALGSLKPREPGRINLYLLAVAGDGSQEVFRREVQYVQAEFAQRFGTAGRSIILVNSRNTVSSAPMATVTSIHEALDAIARRMKKDKDILFLFLTSHGSRDFQLSLDENGMDLQDLAAAQLASFLKDSGIRWKVVVVSACYSGGFVDALQDGRTLVITAARKDRTSFGCSDENDFTYFGRAYFKESLPKAASFQDAFRNADALVRDWELKDASGPAQSGAKPARAGDENRSFPQISSTSAIDAQLARWWGQTLK